MEVTVMLLMMTLGSERMDLWETKKPLLEIHVRKAKNGWKRDAFPVRVRQCSRCGQCLAWLRLLGPRLPAFPHVLSPAGFWLSDEVPGMVTCCFLGSLGTLHTGPGPSSGKGGLKGRYPLTRHPRSGQAPPPADICAGLVLHASFRISDCWGDSVISAAIYLSAWQGKGAGSPPCPLQLNVAGDPA